MSHQHNSQNYAEPVRYVPPTVLGSNSNSSEDELLNTSPMIDSTVTTPSPIDKNENVIPIPISGSTELNSDIKDIPIPDTANIIPPQPNISPTNSLYTSQPYEINSSTPNSQNIYNSSQISIIPVQPIIQSTVQPIPIQPTIQSTTQTIPIQPTIQSTTQTIPIQPTIQSTTQTIPIQPTIQSTIQPIIQSTVQPISVQPIPVQPPVDASYISSTYPNVDTSQAYTDPSSIRDQTQPSSTTSVNDNYHLFPQINVQNNDENQPMNVSSQSPLNNQNYMNDTVSVQDAIPVSSAYSPSSQQNIVSIDFGTIEDYPVNDVDVREALLALVKTKFFWNKSTAKNMIIKNVESHMSYYAKWDTFIDSRTAYWKEEPCTKTLDTPQNGIPPEPFEIETQVPPFFSDYTCRVRVPHTDYMKDCMHCRTTGFVPCEECHNSGYRPCGSCGGTGYNSSNTPCYVCRGSRQVKCSECEGYGRVKCPKCKGNRLLTDFVEVHIHFITETSYSDIYNDLLPPDEFHKSNSDVIYTDSDYIIQPPFLNYPDFDHPIANLKKQSDRIISTKPCRILQQRLTIYRVPVHVVTAEIKKEEFQFVVYGPENLCYCPHYAKKFGNCSIL